MKIRPVILCGGSGTRLWPDSKKHQAKQFIDFGGWTLLEKTLDRIKAYEDAGADMIFPEAMEDESQFEKVRKISKGFLLANMTEFGKSKLLNNSNFFLFTFNFTSASKLDPISLEDLFSSIAIFASCLILNS